MNELVAQLHLKQTRAFIEASPSLVRFQRNVHQSDGAGGTKVVPSPTTLAPQLLRVVEQGQSPLIVAPEGRRVQADVVLVGFPDLDVEVEDTFDHDGRSFEVERVDHVPHRGHHWKIAAEANERV